MDKTYDDDYNKDFDMYAKGNAAVTVAGMVIGGIGKGIAKINQKKADEIYEVARNRYMSSFDDFQYSTEKTKKTITSVVCLKKRIMGNYMKSFLDAYKRLNPEITLKNSQGLGELRKFVFDQEEFIEVRKSTDAYLLYDELQLGEKASNVALLMVQDGTVSNLVNSMRDVIYAGKINDDELKRSSMDNLKIQSIGVIAEFSAVAVEFGLSGMSDAFHSGRQLNEAKEAAAQFEYQKEMIEIKKIKINAINEYANVHLKLLRRFAPMMNEYVTRSAQIIKSKDNIFHFGRIQGSKFSKNELEILAFTLSLVGAVKAIVDSPIISKSGDVYDGNKSDFIQIQNYAGSYESRCLEMREEDQYEGMAYCDKCIHTVHQINELLPDNVEELVESGEVFGSVLWELFITIFENLLSPESWMRKLEYVFEKNDKSVVNFFKNFLETMYLETWSLFFSNADIIINTELVKHQIDREEALLLHFFERLISKMEDAVNDYHKGVRLVNIVCNLKKYIEDFVAEVQYDMKTVQLILDY